MADLDVAVVLRLVDQLSQPAQQAANRLRTVQQGLRNMGQAMRRAGRNMTLGFTLPAAGMVRQVVNFDTAMGDLAKVFQGNSTQLAETRNQIMQMARTIPLAHGELARLFTAANQANIPLREQADFVRLASEFMVAFDTSADNAADALARLKASQGLSVEGLRELSGVMNILATQGAVTEPEMLRLASRIAALGRVAGGQGAVAPLLALGGAAVSMGVDVERASTGLRNMLLNLSAGEGATKRVKDALSALGLESTQVQQSLARDTTGTMLDIFNRIQRLPQAERLGALNNLFGRRAVDALGPLVGNLSEATRLLEAIRDPAARASSVSDEFGKRMERLAPKFQLFMNSLREVSMSIAEHWIGPITAGMNKLKEFLDALTPGQQKFAAFAGGIAAAGGPALVMLSFMASGLSALIAPIRFLLPLFARFKNAVLLMTAATGTTGLIRALTMLRIAALGLLRFFGPVGLLALGAKAIWENWEKISPAFNRVADAAKKIIGQFQPLFDLINKIVEKITGSPIGELLNRALSVFDNVVVNGIVAALNGVAAVLETINAGIEKLKRLGGSVGNLFGRGGNVPGQIPGIPPNTFAPRFEPQSFVAPPRGLATLAATSPVGGRLPPGMTVEARGPQVNFKVPPPVINVTANVSVNSNATPDQIAAQVARVMANRTRAALYDGVNEA